MAAKTTANDSEESRSFACRTIWAASWLWGSPAPEKIGSFWPRTRVFITSMFESPVWMNSLGSSREYGFMAFPVISSRCSLMIFGPPSRGSPRPVNTRPSISSETGSVATSPRNLTDVAVRFMLMVGPNTWTMASPFRESSTCPWRRVPSGSEISTISPYAAFATSLTNSSGPVIRSMVR